MRTLPVVLLPMLASVALAQAPVVTPRGDPSVRNDTIYRLAVNPRDYPDEPYVYLLDDGIVRVEADGRGTRTYRQVVQILKQDAAADFGEQVFSYSPLRERLTVNWLRVLRPDGSVVSDSATHEQESDAPTALAYPVYSDARVHRATLGGVGPGTIVDWSYTIETVAPDMPGDFLTSWRITNGRLTRRSRFLVDAPASLTPRIREQNVGFARHFSEAHGRRVYAWVTTDVPKAPEDEVFAADSNDYAATVTVGSPEHWGDVARWYAGLARDRYAVTPALDSALAEVVGGQRTRDDSVLALYRWVARDFRYVSVALGAGRYQPRLPAQILQTRYGDCKDKATLFIALAQRMGLHAFPVLLNAFGGIDSSVVSVRQFNHVIVALERPGGHLYLDPTAQTVPVGMLPASEGGGFGLIVHSDGQGEPVTLPRDSTPVTRRLVEGEISVDGIFAGHVQQSFEGEAQLGVREALSNDIPASRKLLMARAMANELFEGATGDSLVLFDGWDLGATPRLSLALRDGRATTRSGTTDMLTLGGVAEGRRRPSQNTIAELAARVPRRFHINLAPLFPVGETLMEFRVTLPEGWRARLPANVEATSLFGSYSAIYAQEGRQLRAAWRMVGVRGVFPPDRVDELVTFLRAAARDDAQFIVLEHH